MAAQLLDLGLVCEFIKRAADYGDLCEVGEGGVAVAGCHADRGVGRCAHLINCRGDWEGLRTHSCKGQTAPFLRRQESRRPPSALGTSALRRPVQTALERRRRPQAQPELPSHAWIPACAGMTEWGGRGREGGNGLGCRTRRDTRGERGYDGEGERERTRLQNSARYPRQARV